MAKTVIKTVSYGRKSVPLSLRQQKKYGIKTRQKLVKTGKNVKVTKRSKLTDLQFLEGLPDDQKAAAYKAYRSAQTKDILASTGPATASGTSMAITNMATKGSVSSVNTNQLNQNIQGGMEKADDSRDDDDNPFAS
jgi:hypothetical protein